MRTTCKLLLVLLTSSSVAAQQPGAPDSLYQIQDSVLIPIGSGQSISSIIVRKKGITQPLPVQSKLY